LQYSFSPKAIPFPCFLWSLVVLCHLYLLVVHFCINSLIWATGREICLIPALCPYHAHVTARSCPTAAINVPYNSLMILFGHPVRPEVLRHFKAALLYPRSNPWDIISGGLLPIQAYLGYYVTSNCTPLPQV
jgi:hypothetical protein